MKKMMLSLISFCLFISLYTLPVQATEIDLAPNAKSAYLMEFNSGKVIFAKKENDRLYPASMTKMMGLLLVYEALNEGNIKVSDEVITSELAASMGGSQVFLEVNERMKVSDLLKAICIASANDAMVAMGEKIAGSNEHFINKMNEKASLLKLSNTHFQNASGLHDPNHYSCAKDMAIIARQLLKTGGKALLAITSKYDAYIRENSDKKFWLVNTNKLLKQYPGVDGLKTGFTQEAKSCITLTAKRNHVRLISVVMGEANAKIRNNESKQLLDYGFSMFASELYIPKNKLIKQLKFDNGKPQSANLRCKEDVIAIIEKGKTSKEIKRSIILFKQPLPYKKGKIIANLEIKMQNGTSIKTPLYIDHKIETLNYKDILLKSFIKILT
ncbi:MAG: D-alanyl-D-alanine carboxypeptidase family protein [Erysipelotrichaceae bacterium]